MLGVVFVGCCNTQSYAQVSGPLDQSTIMTRPLFEPTRRGKHIDQPQNDLPVVTGIVGSKNGWTAIFAGEPQALGALNLSAGADINGWHIVSVTPQAVQLRRGDEQQNIIPKTVFNANHPQVKIGN
ncbi:hypothetical protein D5366_08925 [Neokomagataea tanensis]|uniref:Uncharacterized protein n=2 Tax=Neokomagataea TaxID=1223423 RepID=A0A4Y6V9N3_9PROT|nr:hypothetical protein D5366_08925 [Neokomagataea tanensis]